ncbi:hypothetical protein RJT34_21826 [Clitoria ternatea]|uniref:Uncharacterized protein n=1 Tax=Clitoria ternatea TaxID=43366 RepID=A0AAN9IUM7_CLITE
MMKSYPLLLRKFISDKVKLTSLVEIVDKFQQDKTGKARISADASVYQKIWKLCQQQLNIPDVAEDEVNKEYADETNRDAVMKAAAKLIACDVVPKEYLASGISYHFMMHGANVAVRNYIWLTYELPRICQFVRRVHVVKSLSFKHASCSDKYLNS